MPMPLTGVRFGQRSLHGRMIPTRTNTCFSANKWAVEQDLHSDQLDEFGTTALIYAVSDRHTDIVELLLHAGANLEIVSTSPSDDASWRDAGVVIIGSPRWTAPTSRP